MGTKALIILLFCLSFQSVAQQQEFFSFTDTIFKTNAIKRIPNMYADRCHTTVCGDGPEMLDSIAAFLLKNDRILLELGVYATTVKVDTEDGEYFKSLLIKRGIDAERIVVKGYGYHGHELYSRKMIKAAFKKVKKPVKKCFLQIYVLS